MPIGVQQFQIPTFEQANPVLTGASAGQQLISNMLAQRLAHLQAQTEQAKLPYVGPQEAAALEKAKLYNLWYGPEKKSEIGLRSAQTNRFNTLTPLEAQQMSLSNELSRQLNPLQIQQARQQANNPLMQMGDIGKELSAVAYMKNHPEIFNQATNQAGVQVGTQPGTQIPGQSDAASTSQPQAGTALNLYQPGKGFNTGNPMVDVMLNKKYIGTPYQQQMSTAFDWVHTPPDAKNYEVAQLAGAGIDPSEAIQLRTSGKTVPQILQEKGFDPSNPPEPDYLATTANRTQLKMRQAALAEDKVFSDFIKEGLGDFSRTIMGYSPGQIIGAIKNKDSEKQAKFLAARALATEGTTIRLKLAGANIGVQAIRELQHAAMMNNKIFQSLVSPEVFKRSQELITQKLEEGFSAAEKSMTRIGQKNNQQQGSKNYSQEDLEHTAKKYKMSVDEVKKRLGI